jgi:predicted RNA-binding Zn ribbon-like protein
MGNDGGKQNSDWKDGYLFVGNELALDFVNTRLVQDGQAVELLPDFKAVLRWFQAAGLLSSQHARTFQQRWYGSVQARQTVEALRTLREKLRKEILAWEDGGALHRATFEELNRLMAKHPMSTRLRATANRLATEQYFDAREPEDLFARLAHSAAALFATVDRKRVRKCAQCVLHFHDISKKGTRHWCSMRLCGNRQKVAAYAARQRQNRRAKKLAAKPH